MLWRGMKYIALDTDDNIVVQYKYDAWGNHLVLDANGNPLDTLPDMYGNLPLGYRNPFRYRGYIYDTQTGLYYLQSRYYDPVTGRFLNADAVEYLDPESIGGLNLYAYCLNNPVMYADPNGHSVIALTLLAGALIGAVLGAVVDVGKQLITSSEGTSINVGSVVNSAIVGAALGFATTAGVVFLGPIFAGTAATGAIANAGIAFGATLGISFSAGAIGYVAEKKINGENVDVPMAIAQGAFVMAEGAVNFVIGGIVGSFGTIGTKGKPFISAEWWGKLVLAQEFTLPFKTLVDFVRKNI